MAKVINKMKFGNDAYHIASTAYATCDTANNTAAKVAYIDGTSATDGFTLVKGVTVHVKFTNSNTAANPTLSINGSTASAIIQYGTTAASTSIYTSWRAGAVVPLTYDGTNWVINSSIDSDTKNTTGTSPKTMTKLYLAGGAFQGDYAMTYSNAGVFIGEDNSLYSESKRLGHTYFIDQEIAQFISTHPTASTFTLPNPNTAFICLTSQIPVLEFPISPNGKLAALPQGAYLQPTTFKVGDQLIEVPINETITAIRIFTVVGKESSGLPILMMTFMPSYSRSYSGNNVLYGDIDSNGVLTITKGTID